LRPHGVFFTGKSKEKGVMKTKGKTSCFLAVFCACAVLLDPSAADAKPLGTPMRLPDVHERAMAAHAEGHRLYVGASHILYIYDITEALQPKLLGQIGGLGNLRQITSKEGFVYVVSRETGLYIVDAREPSAPKVRSRFDSVEFATGIDVAGNVAILSERQNGVECVDISDPDRPAHIAMRKTAESQSNRYRDGWLFSGDWHSGEITIFDARDMKTLREVARAELHGFGDGFALEGRYLYASTGHDARHRPGLSAVDAEGAGRGLNIIDISAPAQPKPVARLDFPNFKPRNEDFWTTRVSAGMAFCLDSHNGLFVVDVRDPAKPGLLERFTLPDKKNPDWPSAAMSSLAIGDGCIYLTAMPSGAYVIPVEGVKNVAAAQGVLPANASYREPYPTDAAAFHVWKAEKPGQARAVAIAGDIVYAACSDAGLSVLRIKPEGGFEKTGELQGRAHVYDVMLSGSRLFTAEGYDGFGIYELDGPAGFREIGRIPQLSPAADVALWVWPAGENFIIASSRNSGYRFFDVRNPAKPEYVFATYGTCLWDRYVMDKPMGPFLGVSHPYRGVEWIDISGEKPRSAGRDPGNSLSLYNSLCLFGGNSVLATREDLYALEPRTPDGRPPQGAWRFRKLPAAFAARGICGIPRADGMRVAITSRINREVAMYDFSNPDKPVLQWAHRISGNPDTPAFHKGRLVIPAGHQGVLLEKRRSEHDHH
jgi:hypothetical protein